jgi:hypothetical protein
MDARPDLRLSGLRLRLHEIIFEADTPGGKAFDVALIGAILLSVAVVMLESVTSIREQYGLALRLAEWIFTGLFTVEYVLRAVLHRSASQVRSQLLRRRRPGFGGADLFELVFGRRPNLPDHSRLAVTAYLPCPQAGQLPRGG